MTGQRPDFDVGDLVVCVDDGPLSCPSGISPSHHGNPTLKEGRVYRVESTGFRHEVCGCQYSVMTNGFGDFRRFRKIDRADEAFTAMIRQTRKVPA